MRLPREGPGQEAHGPCLPASAAGGATICWWRRGASARAAGCLLRRSVFPNSRPCGGSFSFLGGLRAGAGMRDRAAAHHKARCPQRGNAMPSFAWGTFPAMPMRSAFGSPADHARKYLRHCPFRTGRYRRERAFAVKKNCPKTAFSAGNGPFWGNRTMPQGGGLPAVLFIVWLVRA